MDEELLERKLRQAYMTAIEASHQCALVAIHVSQDVFDALEDRLEKWSAPAPTVARLFGFPLIVEEGAPDWHISVRTRIVIS